MKHNWHGVYCTWNIMGMAHNGYGHHEIGAKWPWGTTGLVQHGQGKLGHGAI